MPKAVRYDEFGGIDVLRVDEVERPVPGDAQVLVRVKAADINPSEAVIRTGALADMFPSTFPSGQGSDLAEVIEEVGAGVAGFSPGDEVIGFSQKRASQAEPVLVEAGDLTRKPEKVSWEVAGSLYVVGVTAWGAVHAVQPEEGETVVISGAAGGSRLAVVAVQPHCLPLPPVRLRSALALPCGRHAQAAPMPTAPDRRGRRGRAPERRRGWPRPCRRAARSDVHGSRAAPRPRPRQVMRPA
ncbi:alcohol dehydrogenase catalytic domain-containing protein [Streptomyces sp. NPDC051366]|uniref:alcohol dehydrogenase catalytic domain-containing protein n=1 Tax=Streptomyces sp. NPDC051366 TaxID=3365652 RepID=UPI00378D22BD